MATVSLRVPPTQFIIAELKDLGQAIANALKEGEIPPDQLAFVIQSAIHLATREERRACVKLCDETGEAWMEQNDHERADAAHGCAIIIGARDITVRPQAPSPSPRA